MDLKDILQNIEEELISIRRDFHMFPELGGCENRTMNKICEYLDLWNIEYLKEVADTGVVAIIRGSKNGKTVAIRADIDALPIIEENDIEYKSKNKGIMHACGHDAHTTIALGAAKILKLMQKDLKGNVKIFFQPAEETTGGAERMINEGCLENPSVDHVLGLHVDPTLKTGTVGIKYGKMMASSDEFCIKVKGKSTHGAYPHQGIDPIYTASNIVVSLQSVISRNLSPLNCAVITIGSINGGTKSNIIPDEVTMTGIIRTLDQNTRDYVKDRIAKIVENITESLGAKGEVFFRESYGALINDDTVTEIVRKTAEKTLGKNNVIINEFPNMGTEDFSYFSKTVKSCFFNLGCRNDDRGIIYPIHSSKFNLDEKCLKIGVELQVNNVMELLNSY